MNDSKQQFAKMPSQCSKHKRRLYHTNPTKSLETILRHNDDDSASNR
ncbi:hypothetical protein ISN45_At03g041420 [Arabidopsis thaliana x Arabidopsis arenosa]|uniref:Uncharacterized protein n=2 Tax=Arabidopsis TaxID=3701 RepID=A0A8T2FGU8_ARASU|nr:hypothetical protein ISN45_At03g041420 [Arabidopsis thaliana x Arabidopsis arenosa]KAG7633760.1 hypothetical protein ISN44_As03g040420 [Arabidopsis suecica]